MPEFNVDVTTADGEMDCFVAHPEGQGPFVEGTKSEPVR